MNRNELENVTLLSNNEVPTIAYVAGAEEITISPLEYWRIKKNTIIIQAKNTVKKVLGALSDNVSSRRK